MRKSVKGIFVLVGTIALTVGSNLQAKADWKQDDGKWWYAVNSEKGYVTNWKYIDGKWYYFDENGYMETGWVEKNENWYYLKNSGEMVTGWYNINGDDWYYFDTNGVMKTTDLVQNNITYHFSASGKCINPYNAISNDSSNWNSSITKESIVYYHDVSEEDVKAAERNAIDRFTTVDIIIEPSTDDSTKKDAMDIDGLVPYK